MPEVKPLVRVVVRAPEVTEGAGACRFAASLELRLVLWQEFIYTGFG